jgi:hypothetical protein
MEKYEREKSWENIRFQDLTVGECIGGGGVAIVYRGIYRKKPIALKTLVQYNES